MSTPPAPTTPPEGAEPSPVERARRYVAGLDKADLPARLTLRSGEAVTDVDRFLASLASDLDGGGVLARLAVDQAVLLHNALNPDADA